MFIIILLMGIYTASHSRWFLRLVYPIKYEDIIPEKSQEYGLDTYLVFAIVKVESGFYPEATSAKGARGLMQLMPETARWIASQRNVGYSQELLYDPTYNLDFGCWYLASLYREFRGDTTRSLAAYNAGRGNVRRWLEENIWNGEDQTQIPFPETRRYLERVRAMARIYRRLYPEYAEKGM